MPAAKKTLDIYRTENAPHDWRWTLTQAGRIIGASSEGYKRKDGVTANILSSLAINLEAAEWDRDDRIVKQGKATRSVYNGEGKWDYETVHVTLWKRK